jgi:hypothetical protein
VGIQQSGFNGQKRSKMNAIAIWRDHAQIWPGLGLVNGGHKRPMPLFLKLKPRAAQNLFEVRKLSFATARSFP